MKIVPLAADSMGTRSMATYVETNDIRILVDPGVSLGPYRYGLPPHRLERERREEHWREIREHAGEAEVLIVTHYHYDHYNRNEPEIYRGKNVLLKHPREKINRSQEWRASQFLPRIKEVAKQIEYADGKEFVFGGTKIRFSEPVPHGPGTRLGYVLEATIIEESVFHYTSDVEGPSLEGQVEPIIKEQPEIVYLDGPLTYLLNFRYSQASLDRSLLNMARIIEKTSVKKLVVDHHFLRDLFWKKWIEGILKTADEAGIILQTSAEFLGGENAPLEAKRKELYEETTSSKGKYS